MALAARRRLPRRCRAGVAVVVGEGFFSAGSRWTSAWMGMVRALGLAAMVILAVVERPGRSRRGGCRAGVWSRVTTTLKSLASSVPVVDCEVAMPVVRSRAWSPTSVTWPLKVRPGRASTVTSAAWPRDVDDVGFIDLDLGGDDGHVGEGHQGGALGVLDADDDGLAFADGDVGDEAVEGGAGDGLVESVEVGALAGDGLVEVAALGVGLGLGLGEGGLALLRGSRRQTS